MSSTLLAAGLLYLPLALAQIGVVKPLVQDCSPNISGVVCINKYASVMPYHFFRDPPNITADVTLGQTSVSNDTSWVRVGSADFLVFDQQKAMQILGPKPTYEYVFHVSGAVHEAPVYVPAQNKLYMSQLAPPAGYLPQLVVDLNANPPTLSEYLSDPPVYAPNGGTFHKGLIYWGASGGNNSIGGIEQRVGVITLDPLTNKTNVLLNNYYGYYFNTVDDLVVDARGDVWFTDPQYSWFNALTDTPPQLETACYRFRPSTGEVSIVDDTILQPNGIALSPDGKHVYISDTGMISGTISAAYPDIHGVSVNHTSKRTIYKFDLTDNGTHITGKRPIWLSQDWVPDGLKVARNGYVVTGSGKGVDVMDDQGHMIARVQTNYTVQNFAWTGKNWTDFWIMGQGGVSKVTWNLQGQELL
ncbi:hypothetical protein LTR16_002321 [Cryomyces antarcticus]|uniref:SMP-30/Gluconolactonase/LRE-like region domain-containing protein n=1 Tax=Cryomyces antarcticus TaxID=329879 RepID=A0ABR0KTB4_9PEZI|nr:hypothetical protein LTR16_002321 [Cryomyces antarcticus]